MIQFESVTKSYPNGFTAVRDLDLQIEAGEFVCLIGPSGCGKTTTLKLINRLTEPTAGTIRLQGQDIMSMDPVQLRRGIGYVIQQIGLLPHMTIRQNIELVPRLVGWEPERRQQRAFELLDMVGLDPTEYADRYPRQLSGGQQQRVGVMRALAAEPDLILMDEPFGALDPITRDALQEELKRLQSRLRKTVVFVTHDMAEALKLADRIVIMRDGVIHQQGTPEELLRNPKDEFVARFVGRDTDHAEALTVGDFMTRRTVTVDPEHGLAEAVVTMRERRVSSLLVVDNDDHLLGVLTARLMRANRDKAEARTVSDIMQQDYPVVTSDSSFEEAFERMLLDHLDFLPVVTLDGRLEGLVTHTSLVDVLARVLPWNGSGTVNGNGAAPGKGVSA